MKTYNVKTYRSVLFELNHCVKAEDKASAIDQCINWFEDDREIMDHVPDWIDPVEEPAVHVLQLADPGLLLN